MNYCLNARLCEMKREQTYSSDDDDDDDDDDDLTRENGIENNKNKNRPKLTIILCDDNRVNLKILAKMFNKVFRESSVEILRCEDGTEAIDCFKAIDRSKNKLAMIVMDFNMPQCDGLSACKYIRALEKFRADEEREKAQAAQLRTNTNEMFKTKTNITSYEKVPILMFTTEFKVVLPMLIEGIVDDRLAKPCSVREFVITVHKHMPTFVLNNYQDVLIPLHENTLLHKNFHSEKTLGDIIMDSNASTMSSIETGTHLARAGDNAFTQHEVSQMFYDWVGASDDDDDDDDQNVEDKHKEAHRNARWNLFFSSFAKSKAITNNNSNKKRRKNSSNSGSGENNDNNNNNCILEGMNSPKKKKRLSLDSYVRACKDVWLQTKRRLAEAKKNRKERAFLIKNRNNSVPQNLQDLVYLEKDIYDTL